MRMKMDMSRRRTMFILYVSRGKSPQCEKQAKRIFLPLVLLLLSIKAIDRAFGSSRDDLESAQSSVVAALPFAQTAGPTSV